MKTVHFPKRINTLSLDRKDDFQNDKSVPLILFSIKKRNDTDLLQWDRYKIDPVQRSYPCSLFQLYVSFFDFTQMKAKKDEKFYSIIIFQV